MDELLIKSIAMRAVKASKTKEQALYFIGGEAGSGKSTACRKLCSILRCHTPSKAVLVVAPSTFAASNVNGSTIQSAFFSTQNYRVIRNGVTLQLTFSNRSLYNDHLRYVKFLIVDDISCVNDKTLNLMSFALQRAKKKPNVFFGGVHVFLFGDFMQLPPSAGNFAYKNEHWNLFETIILHRQFRQNTCKHLYAICQHLRHGIELPIGLIPERNLATIQHEKDTTLKAWDTWTAIRNRFSGRISLQEKNKFKDAIHIFDSNIDASKWNIKIFNETGTQRKQFLADDTYFRRRSYTSFVTLSEITLPQTIAAVTSHPTASTIARLSETLPATWICTCKFERLLEIAVGSIVMLRADVDKSRGLVSGVLGYVKNVEPLIVCFRRPSSFVDGKISTASKRKQCDDDIALNSVETTSNTNAPTSINIGNGSSNACSNVSKNIDNCRNKSEGDISISSKSNNSSKSMFSIKSSNENKNEESRKIFTFATTQNEMNFSNRLKNYHQHIQAIVAVKKKRKFDLQDTLINKLEQPSTSKNKIIPYNEITPCKTNDANQREQLHYTEECVTLSSDVSFTEIMPGIYLKRVQYPIGVGPAFSLENMPGFTLDRIVLHISKSMSVAKLYTALSRIKSLDDILLVGEEKTFLDIMSKAVSERRQQLKETPKNIIRGTLKIPLFIEQLVNPCYTRKSKLG